ncbi:MAG TPA: glycoside hydrolase family 3 N-terminal domain-containing protein [Thermoanaerobaculia bacterium]|nr:glycoside hydrolase family 3 N-terminal domain-containing protein [Thermoanaerobaculia bacterium]
MKTLRPRLAALFASALLGCAPARVTTDRRSSFDVETLLGPMTLEEKVGQLIVVPTTGVFRNEASPKWKELERHVTANHVGGVIYFRSNVYETALQIAALQRLAKLPLLVSADLESGAGMRFEDVTWAPTPMAVAATGDPSLAERLARATAEEARAIGVAQIFAPIADVNVNPDNPVINTRSFGEDPADVSRFVTATVKGLQDGGVLATLKHFPGHGDTAVDSHRSLPVLAFDRKRLESVELAPFRAGIASGARSVMVAHLSVPSLDPEPAPPLVKAAQSNVFTPGVTEVETKGTVPASLSPSILGGILRKELGFSGLVVTDSMTMGGLVAHFASGEAAVRAILAGNDMVLMPQDVDAAIRAVLDAVRSGRIPPARLDESVRRILTEKRRLGLFETRTPPLDAIARVVGSPVHEAVAEEVARRAITLVREAPGALPLDAKRKIAFVAVLDEALPWGPSGTIVTEIAKRQGADVRSIEEPAKLDPRSSPTEIDAVVNAAAKADVVLLAFFVRARSGTGKIAAPDSAKAAVPRLLALKKPVVAVSFGTPYLLRDFPDLPTYLCAYGVQEVTQVAAARALFGEAAIEGKLPVTLPGLAPRGTGIRRAAGR